MPELFKQKHFNPAANKGAMACQKFSHTFPMGVILLLTNCAQLLLYIFYEQHDLYLLVTTKASLVATTRDQVNANRL